MDRKIYLIKVNGTLIEVSREVYLAYYRSKRYERHLAEKDAARKLVHYAALDTLHHSGEEELRDEDAESIEDIVCLRVMIEKLNVCLGLLAKSERELICALYFAGKTERQYAAETGIPRKTINNRRRAILKKIKNMLKQKNNVAQTPLEPGCLNEGVKIPSHEP